MEGDIFAMSKTGTFPGSRVDYGGFSIDLKECPFNLKIEEGKAYFSWSGETNTNWQEMTTGANIMPYGGVTVAIKIAREGELTVTDSSFLFPQFIFAEFYSGDGSEKDGVRIDFSPQSCPALQKGSGCREYVPSEYKSMKIHVPSIALTLPGFDFFLETNLLAPGLEVIDIDEGAGVQTPHDFLIVGHTLSRS